MAPLEWSDQIATHIGVIDYEHKQLVALFNEVEALGGTRATQEDKMSVLRSLRIYANKHFLVEEELMLAHAYPKYEAHRLEHEEFRSKIEQVEADLKKSDMDIMVLVATYLGRWIVNHIQKVDKHLADYLIHEKTQGTY
jgi:hemerythrin